ncbi:MAG TPA: hypothetical protein VIJ16_10650 [Gemmatimonadaceae bacterium]
MTSVELENLVRSGQLKREAPSPAEIAGLLHSGEARLGDATRLDLSLESRFDLAYNAAHAFSLAALRRAGYRSENRYIVFQVLSHTLGVSPTVWRILAKCHGIRNQAEYEGVLEIDKRLIDDLIAAATSIRDALQPHPGSNS